MLKPDISSWQSLFFTLKSLSACGFRADCPQISSATIRNSLFGVCTDALTNLQLKLFYVSEWSKWKISMQMKNYMTIQSDLNFLIR